ncbi:MAG: phosphoglycerate kinase [Nanoarchaeota archaeon]|nr:phosphoglycerate kinase [Nanoarchaeota archaeon]MBU1622392.1 phosphoglycerate kinase [Nanoarchaeota archaeon]
MKTFSLINFPLENKTVLLRVDYNVPLEKRKVVDNSKIKLSLPTIKYLLEKNCKIVLATHLGRPQGKINPELKVDPIVKELKKLLPKQTITKFNHCFGQEIKQKIKKAEAKQIFLLENLRFYPEEKNNDPVFAHSLANLADVYINEAFSNSHRQHASMSAITRFLPAFPGPQLEKEIFFLNKALKPKKPAVWIIGGGKLDKVKFVEQALKKADQVLLGGALAFPFLRANGIRIGMSKIDAHAVRLAKKILQKRKFRKKITLPIDFVVAKKLSPREETAVVNYNEIKSEQITLDLGPKTVELFKKHLTKAKTIVWNGPLGYFEYVKFAQATKEIGRFLGKLDCLKIAGGGETATAINKFHLAHNFTHVSTGGGASLMFLSGEKLPALKALEKNYTKFRKKIKK